MGEHEMVIADRLRQGRITAGLTQAQVATLLGLSRESITQIEAGRRRVKADESRQLADIYGVDIAWLTGDGEATDGLLEIRIRRAAQELANLSKEDLDKLLSVIRTLKEL